jgi:hypothetical protein
LWLVVPLNLALMMPLLLLQVFSQNRHDRLGVV